jgi:hypothetical protein
MSTANDVGAFVLRSLERAVGPEGSEGHDWFRYQIVQGTNIVSGHRRGTVADVRAYVEGIVTALNDRRALKRGRVNLVNETTQPRNTAAKNGTA